MNKLAHRRKNFLKYKSSQSKSGNFKAHKITSYLQKSMQVLSMLLMKLKKHADTGKSLQNHQRKVAYTSSDQRFGSRMINGKSSDGCIVSESKKWSTASAKCKSNSKRNPTWAWTKDSISFVISPSLQSSSIKETASPTFFLRRRSLIWSSGGTFW